MFLDKNAPPIVAVEREMEDGIGDREEGGQADEEGLEEEEDGDLEEVEREVQFALHFLLNFVFDRDEQAESTHSSAPLYSYLYYGSPLSSNILLSSYMDGPLEK